MAHPALTTTDDAPLLQMLAWTLRGRHRPRYAVTAPHRPETMPPVELDALRNLPTDDQQVFLLGRILSETTRLDGMLRLLHSALRNEREGLDMLALYDSPDSFAKSATECLHLIDQRDGLDHATRAALQASVVAARAAYKRRNRFVHDLLREDFLNRGWWELSRMQRRAGEIEPETEILTFDDVVHVVLDLVAAVWRLRGASLFVISGRWEAYAVGEVEGHWDGTATASR